MSICNRQSPLIHRVGPDKSQQTNAGILKCTTCLQNGLIMHTQIDLFCRYLALDISALRSLSYVDFYEYLVDGLSPTTPRRAGGYQTRSLVKICHLCRPRCRHDVNNWPMNVNHVGYASLRNNWSLHTLEKRDVDWSV